MEHPVCGTCAYWVESADDVEKGFCIRHAPQPFVHGPRDAPEDPYSYTARPSWPETHTEDACGEHPDFPAWIEHRRQDPAAHARAR